MLAHDANWAAVQLVKLVVELTRTMKRLTWVNVALVAGTLIVAIATLVATIAD